MNILLKSEASGNSFTALWSLSLPGGVTSAAVYKSEKSRVKKSHIEPKMTIPPSA
jgi:hypothetical protein